MTKAKFYRDLKQISDDFHSNLLELLKFKITVPESLSALGSNRELSLNLLSSKDSSDQNVLKYFKEELDSIKNLPPIVYPMALVFSISLFEVYLNKVTGLLLNYFWQTLKTRDKSIAYEDLLSCDSIDEVKHMIIENETRKIAFGSIRDRIDYLEKKFHLKFEYRRMNGIRNNWNSIELESLIEIHSTRNLIIHNNSIVNETYIKENKLTKLRQGEKREVTKEYAMDSLFVLFRVSGSIYNVALKKVKTARG